MQLIKYDAACRALAEAKAIDEVKDWRDKAQALQAYARQAKNRQLEVDAAEIRIRAERRLGGMLAETPKHEGGRPTEKPVDSDDRLTLDEMGISRDLSSRAQQIASIAEDEFEAELAQHREEQSAVTGRTMERLAKKAHVANNSGENEWYTPSEYIEAARTVMGSIDLDPASCEAANAWVKADRFYSIDDDGLTQWWGGNVWLNPPYAQPLIGQFCSHLVAAVESGDVAQAITLTNNATETEWGQQLLGSAGMVCFPSRRIRFIDRHGNKGDSPLQGQMICYFGSSRENRRSSRFADVFSSFGVVVDA